MEIRDLWYQFCDWEPQYATEDDWVHFIDCVYADWRQRCIANDPDCRSARACVSREALHSKYGFHVFAKTSKEFCEIENLNASRFTPR